MFAHLEPEERGCAVRRRVAGRRGGRAKNWRRERDSNPRYRLLPVRRFSKPLLSATQPSLRAGWEVP